MEKEKKYMVELTQSELLEIQLFVCNKKTYEKSILENRLDFNAKFKDDGLAWSPQMIKESEDRLKFFETLYNKLINAYK